MTGFNIHPAAIINQIKNLLKERYKEGFPIIKEIIQNANDGGATKLDFGVTLGLGDRVEHPLLKSSALFFINNGHFSRTDEQAISYIGVDSNARDGSKIGKFGLGQKSVFHFCEAYFFIARSPEIPGGCGRFLNPWASGIDEDTKRPDWINLSFKDRQKIVEFLIQKRIIKNEQEKYFVLWIPLRQQQPDNRCILANYYDENSIQTQLPSDMASKISLLLPLLKHLESVSYWIPEKNGDLIRKFHVYLESNKLQRCLYPEKKQSNYIQVQRNLYGSIIIDSSECPSSFKFAGQESIIGQNIFQSLLDEPIQIHENFWTTLQQSPYWSKREAIDEHGDTYNVPDKSIPHCAVVFSQNRTRANKNAKLSIQWAVFLPLSSDCDREEFEEYDCNGERDYSLVLHGYFFLDSGRTSIEALRSIREGTLAKAVPNSEEEMVQQWNCILAKEGTLKQIIPALEQFVLSHNLSTKEIANLCNSLKQSRLFKSKSFRNSIYAEHKWIYRIQPTNSAWVKLATHKPVYTIPKPIPDWKIFCGFKQIADNSCLTLKNCPNLQPLKNEVWTENNILLVLQSLEAEQIFSDSEYINYLALFLEHSCLINVGRINEPNISESIQDELVKLLKAAFENSNFSRLEQYKESIQELVTLVSPSKRLKIDASERSIKKLYELSLEVLIVPQNYDPINNKSGNQLEYQDSLTILEYLTARSSNIQWQELKRLLKAVWKASQKSLIKLLQNNSELKFILGYTYKENQNYIYSFDDINQIKAKYTLFGYSDNNLAHSLQAVLNDREVVLLDRSLVKLLAEQNKHLFPICDRENCLKVLATKPILSSPEYRIDLLNQLLQAELQSGKAELRYLLHGNAEEFDSDESLYIFSQDNSVWQKIAQKVLETNSQSWRVISPILAKQISPTNWHKLNISNFEPDEVVTLIRNQGASSVNGEELDFREREQLLAYIGQKSQNENLWKDLRLHETIDNRLVSIESNTYLKNPDFLLDEKLQNAITLIKRSLNIQQTWIPVWNAEAAIQVILNLPNSHEYFDIILNALNILPLHVKNELIPNLQAIPWLTNRQRDTFICPQDIIYIVPKRLRSHTESIIELSQNKYSISELNVSIQRNPEFNWLTQKLFNRWKENNIIECLLATSNPSQYCDLIIDVLTSILSKRQDGRVISLSNIERLAEKKWLTTEKYSDREVNPKQVIYFPDIPSEELEELLQEEPYVAYSLLSQNVRSNELVFKWLENNLFVVKEDALNIIGKILSSNEQYYLGDLELDRFSIEDWRNTFHNVDRQILPVWSLIDSLAGRPLNQFQQYILPNICQTIEEERLVNLLNWISDSHLQPNKKVINVYNQYLQIASSSETFKQQVLPNIKLLNRTSKWSSPNILCHSNGDININLQHILDDRQKDILIEHLENAHSISEERDDANSENIQEKTEITNRSLLSEYFQPWQQQVPSEIIGGFLSILTSNRDEIKNLANSYLRRRDVVDVRQRLMERELFRPRKFQISIHSSEENIVEISSLLGTIFQASLIVRELPETIFVGNIDNQTRKLRLLRINNLNSFGTQQLSEILKNSAEQLIINCYGIEPRTINVIWEDLSNSEQLDIQVAKNLILENLPYLLRSLGVPRTNTSTGKKINQILSEWDEKRHIRADLERRGESLDNVNKRIKEIFQGLCKLLEDKTLNNKVCKDVLDAVRQKISQHGYSIQSIPFELFQNADDALVELEKIQNDRPIDPEKERFIISCQPGELMIFHWGRSINCFRHPDIIDCDLRNLGYDRDLEKMLAFNISDKTEGTTGKFGLGFKSVHLVCQQPHVLSSYLGFKVCGGILPSQLLSEETYFLQQELEKHQNNVTDGTVIHLKIDEEIQVQSENIVSEFNNLAAILLIFAKRIKSCQLISTTSPKNFDWQPHKILGLEGIEADCIAIKEKTKQVICFRLANQACLLILFQVNSNLISNFRNFDIPTIWVTAPTKEKLGLGFILNAQFDITTGREKLIDSSNNQEIAEQIGSSIGQQLEKLFLASQNNWEIFQENLRIPNIDQYSFWNFIWEELALSWLDKDDSSALQIIRSALGGDNGMGYFITHCASLPSGLAGKYRQLTLPKNIDYVLAGILNIKRYFNKVATWQKFQQRCHSHNNVIHGDVWKKLQSLLGDSFRKLQCKAKKIVLLDIVKWELGDSQPFADVNKAEKLGELISQEWLNKIKVYHQEEYDKIIVFLQQIQFLSENNTVNCNNLLILKSEDNEEESLLAAFAPKDRLLNSEYSNHYSALNFFLACRNVFLLPDERDITTWIKNANQSENKKEAVRKYLLYLMHGKFKNSFVDVLINNIDWLQNDPVRCLLDKTLDNNLSTNNVIIGDDGTSDKQLARKYGKQGEEWAKILYQDHLEYQVENKNTFNQSNPGFDLLCIRENQELKVEVKAIDYTREFIRITITEWIHMIDNTNMYELLIYSHDGDKIKEIIRIKQAWLTLKDILSQLPKQTSTICRYSSGEIEPLIGFQLNEGDKNNDIILNWHRCFKQFKHCDVELYQLNSIDKLIKVSN